MLASLSSLSCAPQSLKSSRGTLQKFRPALMYVVCRTKQTGRRTVKRRTRKYGLGYYATGRTYLVRMIKNKKSHNPVPMIATLIDFSCLRNGEGRFVDGSKLPQNSRYES